jgi:hypothetical protein
MAVLSEKPDFPAMISWLPFGKASEISNPIISFALRFRPILEREFTPITLLWPTPFAEWPT